MRGGRQGAAAAPPNTCVWVLRGDAWCVCQALPQIAAFQSHNTGKVVTLASEVCLGVFATFAHRPRPPLTLPREAHLVNQNRVMI